MRRIITLLLFIFFFSWNNKATAQSIQDQFNLETIIPIKFKGVSIAKLKHDAIISSTNKFIHLAFSYDLFENDTGYILSVNKNTYEVTYSYYILTSEQRKTTYHSLYSFTSNDTLFALGYFNSIVVLATSKTNELNILQLIKTEQSCEYLKLTSKFLFGGNLYKRKEGSKSAMIYKYSRNNLSKSADRFNFDYPCIEFSYFQPNHWIEIDENYIFIAHTCDYKIDLYDLNFQHISQTNIIKKNWVNMDKTTLERLINKIPVTNPVNMIDSLSSYNDKKISRVIGLWKLNENQLCVGWYNFDSSSNRTKKFLDILEIKNNKLIPIKEDLYDQAIFRKDSSLVLKEEYPIMYWNYNSEISNNFIIVFRNTADIDYINTTWKSINENEKKYYKLHNPIPALFIYRKK